MPSPVWGSIYDQRKIPLHLFTIGFQKPGICADSWFLESNGKMVQWDFSLIINLTIMDLENLKSDHHGPSNLTIMDLEI